MDMADRLREFRERLGYNQQGLADAAGIRQATWSRWEKEPPDQIELASEIHIALADLGIGIEESLDRRHPLLRQRFQHGSQYIQHAFEQGVSGQPGMRGIGLHRVGELVQQWHGSLFVRSAQSSVRIENGAVECQDGLAPVPGVQVSIVVRGIAANQS